MPGGVVLSLNAYGIVERREGAAVEQHVAVDAAEHVPRADALEGRAVAGEIFGGGEHGRVGAVGHVELVLGLGPRHGVGHAQAQGSGGEQGRVAAEHGERAVGARLHEAVGKAQRQAGPGTVAAGRERRQRRNKQYQANVFTHNHGPTPRQAPPARGGTATRR